ncbi:MAG TPA: hypothetical protein VJ770_02845 [Stellaceae bacterium]|nr:hypothetical protein [Stellaceae bacterium]
MINLAGLTPVGVRCTVDGARLQWPGENGLVETGFERFRPVGLRLLPQSGALRIEWRDFGDLPMTDNFFQGTLKKARALTDRTESFETDWEVVSRLACQPGNLPFSGAIFHMARTGSTLVHRLFSKTGRVLSLSELGIIDRALILTTSWPQDECTRVLRELVAALGRPRRAGERHLVIKMTDATPNTRLHRFRDAFPEVPWIFIYRDPVEVMVSILRGPTGSMKQWLRRPVHFASRLGMPALADRATTPEEFVARTLRRFCAAAVEAAKATPPGLFLAVPYTRLPDAVWETIAPHFGVGLSEEDRDVMRAEARYKAKSRTDEEFKPDSEAKRGEATGEIVALARRHVMPMIEELRALPQA